MRASFSGVAAAAILLLASIGSAQSPTGGELPVNSHTAGDQGYPALCRHPNGEYTVAWESVGQDGSGRGVFARRLNASGDPLGAEFQLNEEIAGHQQLPALACDAGGSFTAVWESQSQDGDGYGIYGRRFDAANQPAGREFQINTVTADNQLAPASCGQAGGRSMVVWQSFGEDGDGYGIYARRLDASGTPDRAAFRVNGTTAQNQKRPAVACLANDEVVVVWQSRGQDGDGEGIFGQLYGDDGAAVGGEFQVNENGDDNQRRPTITSVGAGFLVAWESSEYPDGHTLYARRFAADGQPTGGDFRVNSDDFWRNEAPIASGDATGNAIVAWSGGPGRRFDVLARRYDAAGDPLGDDLRLSSSENGNQGAVSFLGRGVAISGDAEAQMATWQSTNVRGDPQDGSGSGIFGQRFAPCPGDCVPDGQVQVGELVVGVNIALGIAPTSDCEAFDSDDDGGVSVHELIAAVRGGLLGCGGTGGMS